MASKGMAPSTHASIAFCWRTMEKVTGFGISSLLLADVQTAPQTGDMVPSIVLSLFPGIEYIFVIFQTHVCIYNR